jgi:uncharacterized glyoxalase superfamily protein PhnB
MAMNANSLSVSLTVKDIRTSLAWYRDVLGFTVAQEYERGGALRAVSLSAGVGRVLLSQDDGAKGADRAKGEGISFMLTTEESVDALATQAKAAGAALDSEPSDAFGRRAFRLRDPDGFRIAISSEQRT